MSAEESTSLRSGPDDRHMPSSAFLLGAFAPILAAVLTVAAPAALGPYALLVWLLGFLPLFLLSRHMKWRGALLGLTWTAFLLVVSQFTVSLVREASPDWRLVGAVTVALAAVALGAGLNEQWHGVRAAASGTTQPVSVLRGDLPTRDVLGYFLGKVFAGARRQPPLSIVLLEIDRVRDYAGMYGASVAAQAMEGVVGTLRRHVRSMNVFGLYDDHALLVLLHGEGLAGAHAFAQRILEEAASSPAPWKGRVRLSAGIAGFEPAIEHPETLIGQARQALETAQRMGGNMAVIYQGNVPETLVTPGMTVLQPSGQVKEIHRSV